MKGLPALIRLHRWQLDEKRRELADLQRLEDDMLARVQGLLDELTAEQEYSRGTDTGGLTYGGFIVGVSVRRHRMEESITEIRRRIDAKREELADSFRDLKRYETTLAQREKRAALEADRRAQAALDEISMIQFQRKAPAAA
jgi:flagellar protein FliJ